MNMYRCEICCNVSPSGQHMLRHTIYRKVEPREVKNRVKDSYGNFRTSIRTEPERMEIAREVALCKRCYEQVQSGTPLHSLNSPRRIPITHILVEEQSPKISKVNPTNNRIIGKGLGNKFPNGTSPNKDTNKQNLT